MIIVFHKDTILTPHRHPVGRSESYYVIEGAMNVYFFDDNGKVIGIIKLEERSKNYNFYYRLSSHTWHLPVPTTEYMVYHETITGPFLTEADIEYPTWKDKYDTAQKINHFLILQKKMYSLKRSYSKDLNSKSLSFFFKKDTKALVDKHLLIELKKLLLKLKKI